ncbi:MAG: MFS transporter [Chloroflexi bacterium]|nr:MFS transporter [Chloroflexota bacterium]MCI0581000.1 MFS transporter [Chloroflexota bacterium]MCI0646339.1 MFS transporter [Chloroflexota bacterium]MCI0726963.1 MFS transporter [Chloroflexota bacterium]
MSDLIAGSTNTLARFRQVNSFWALWTATAVSNLADGVFKLALPLLAARLTTSPSLVAGVAFAVRLPWLLFALPAGALADRHDRQQMMVGANLLRMGVLAALVVGFTTDLLSLPFLYLVALALGVAETLADTAASTVLPSIVKPAELERANARLVGVTTITNEFIGPPLGGAIAALSLALAFGASSGLYLAAALALLLMAGSFRPVNTSRPQMLVDIRAGLHYVWNHALLRSLAIIVAVMNLGWSAWAAVMVLYVVAPGPGGLSEFGYGVLLTSIGIGGVAGALLATPLVRWLGRRWAIGADILGTFVMLAIPAFTANPWAIGAAAVIGGIGSTMWGVVVTSIRQQVVPDAMLGRVSGVMRLFGFGSLSLGAAVAGGIAEVAGLPAVFAFCAFLTVLLLPLFGRLEVGD